MSNPDGQLRPWRQIAQELAQEHDPAKVTALANELSEALEMQGPSPHVRPENPAEAASPRKT